MYVSMLHASMLHVCVNVTCVNVTCICQCYMSSMLHVCQCYMCDQCYMNVSMLHECVNVTWMCQGYMYVSMLHYVSLLHVSMLIVCVNVTHLLVSFAWIAVPVFQYNTLPGHLPSEQQCHGWSSLTPTSKDLSFFNWYTLIHTAEEPQIKGPAISFLLYIYSSKVYKIWVFNLSWLQIDQAVIQHYSEILLHNISFIQITNLVYYEIFSIY